MLTTQTRTVTIPGVPSISTVSPIDDPRARHATARLVPFLFLAAQLVAFVFVLRAFQIEERAFLNLMGVATLGFMVHYWLPFQYKERFWILLSLGGATLVLGPGTVIILLVVGVGWYVLLASPLSYRLKLWGVVSTGGLLMAARATGLPIVPAAVWPILAALFMFRMIIYLYELRQATSRPSLQEYLAYFYPLPNFYFLLYPVVDLQTQRRSFYQRDIHLVAQQGMLWMVRGAVHLLLYRLVYFLKPTFSPDEVTSFGTLAAAMIGTYLLYLRVSGQFHIIVGLLHLFGYDLPETHRKYLLASSIADFWRRINIYWKDFMVKVVYFPVYFKFRRSGDLRARVLATIAVFVLTWALHSYQWFWLRGEWLLSWTDALFWGILGALVVVNLLLEQRRPVKPTARAYGRGALRHWLQVAATFLFITMLWSFWQTPTIEEWMTTVGAGAGR